MIVAPLALRVPSIFQMSGTRSWAYAWRITEDEEQRTAVLLELALVLVLAHDDDFDQQRKRLARHHDWSSSSLAIWPRRASSVHSGR